MSDISIRRKHGLSADKIKTITQQVVSAVQGEFPSLVSDIQWNSDQTEAKVKGKGFTGTFGFNAEEIMVDIDLSFFAKPFKGTVSEKIQERLNNYLGA